MHQIWFNAEIEQIDRMIYYIMSEGIPVDYQVMYIYGIINVVNTIGVARSFFLGMPGTF